MDRIEAWAMVGGDMTKIELEARDISSVHMTNTGRTSINLSGCIYKGKPVTGVLIAHAEVVFTYMERHD